MASPPSAPLAVILSLLLAGAALAQAHQEGPSTDEKLGTVHFSTSCSAAAQPLFNRAVALLHSFEFAQAIAGFRATLETDPSCAMAEWGIALSRWGNPFVSGLRPPGQLLQGRDAVNRARTIGAATARERAYLDAVSQLYAGFETIDQRTRMLAYRDAMERVAEANPDDTEASVFYALSIAAAASPADRTHADLLKSGAILEKIAASQPDHPGISHYIIHSYDVPSLAARALDAAWCYGKIAPAAPHALHMPSHTFTRLGYWQESIDANIASGAAAKREGSTAEELHTLDYRTYAYLQTAQDGAAREILDALPEVWARFDPEAVASAAPGSAGFFALAAIPARYALERGAWADAAKLVLQPSGYLYADALTYFAKALGAARGGDAATARSAIDALAQIEARLTEQKEAYWAEQVEIQRRSASAWLALVEGRRAEALVAMRAAAAMEDGTEKSAVTPGPLAPARELVGEMLLQMDQPAAALKEFEATLEREPNRFRALFGAARSASLAGDPQKARAYSGALLKICARADKPGRPELEQARRMASGSR
jgi:PAS domain-containing protein